MPEEMLLGFAPPARFARVRFSNYTPNVAFPSQAAIRSKLEQLVRPVPKSLLERFKKPSPLPSLYLDGGFGVGKTHLIDGADYRHREGLAAPEPLSNLRLEKALQNGVLVIAYARGDVVQASDPDSIQTGDKLVLLGKQAALERLRVNSYRVNLITLV
jgi:hypothetical protein